MSISSNFDLYLLWKISPFCTSLYNILLLKTKTVAFDKLILASLGATPSLVVDKSDVVPPDVVPPSVSNSAKSFAFLFFKNKYAPPTKTVAPTMYITLFFIIYIFTNWPIASTLYPNPANFLSNSTNCRLAFIFSKVQSSYALL